MVVLLMCINRIEWPVQARQCGNLDSVAMLAD